MKKALTLIALVLITYSARSQENMITVSGGYTFANPEASDEMASGFRINGLYEFNKGEGKIAHGANLGYLVNSFSETNDLGSTDYEINTWALYYAPKIMFGNSEKFTFFLKGAIGMQSSNYQTDGPTLDVEGSDVGFYGGAGLGGMLFITSKVFLNLEYEWAYMSNTLYEDGFMNTAQLGIGFRF